MHFIFVFKLVFLRSNNSFKLLLLCPLTVEEDTLQCILLNNTTQDEQN